MKYRYKDYLILPVLVMYLIYASCTYIANADSPEASGSAAQVAAVKPDEIVSSFNSRVEFWYADGMRGGACFSIGKNETGSSVISFFANSEETANEKPGAAYLVSGMHLCCSEDGKRYDLVFADDTTAYETISGVTYHRADYSRLKSVLIGGKFVNTTNSKDYYVFKSNGKCKEYFEDRVYNGTWNFCGEDTVAVYDKVCKESFELILMKNAYGDVFGFNLNGNVYSRVK